MGREPKKRLAGKEEQLGEVSLMKAIWTSAASGFFVGLDFWVLAAASGIALGTCLLRCPTCQATDESSKS